MAEQNSIATDAEIIKSLKQAVDEKDEVVKIMVKSNTEMRNAFNNLTTMLAKWRQSIEHVL